MENTKILVFGNVDLNLIDGSSIWLLSLVDVLCREENVEIDILLKTPIKTEVLVKDLREHNNVNLVDPWESIENNNSGNWKNQRRLKDEKIAVEILNEQFKKREYEHVIVRGLKVANEVTNYTDMRARLWGYVTGFPYREEEITEDHRNMINRVFKYSKFVLCQTELMKKHFLKFINEFHEKAILLPPMIPDYCNIKPSFINKNNSLVYVGKFSDKWFTIEMIEAFKKIKKVWNEIKFNIAGNKFNISKDNPRFKDEMMELLLNTRGVYWHKGISRKKAIKVIEDGDLGIIWRSNEVDDNLEISTKMLEYGRSGIPFIVNRNQVYEEFLGSDYPYFANSEMEFCEKIKLALTDVVLYKKTAEKVYEQCKKNTISNIHKSISKFLKRKTVTHPLAEKIKVLFVGHDFKFANILIKEFEKLENVEVRKDEWLNHQNHDARFSIDCSRWADVIICEWGLGNAVWYSKRKRENQILIVRMHLQELRTKYHKEFDVNNIDKIITIADHTHRDFIKELNLPHHKLMLIYNIIDTEKLGKPKKKNAEFNIGLMGMCPKRKGFHRALEIFEALWRGDPRYKFYIKGKMPKDYCWLWKKKDEREYFEDIFKKIESSEFKDSIIFSGWGNDVEEWFRNVGYVLSTSDFEGSHQSVAEGMATGAIPIITPWEGADEIYPKEFVFKNIEDACEFIRDTNNGNEREEIMEHVKDVARNKFDKKLIFLKWKMLLNEQLKKIGKKLNKF